MKFIGKVIFLIPTVAIFIVFTLLFGTIPFIASGPSLVVIELVAYLGLVGFYQATVEGWMSKRKFEKHVWVVPAVLLIVVPILYYFSDVVSCGK